MLFRQLKVALILLVLCWSTVACTTPANRDTQGGNFTRTTQSANTRIQDGQYPVQQVTYNDGGGEYTLMLLNTAPGTPATYQVTNLQMARLTDEEIKAGKQSYLKVEGGQPTLYLTPDFRIEYIHNVTETQTNPQTGQPETVVVRQEPSFWTPFAAAIAGQAVASWLFTPRYYMPPVYQGGGPLIGYGGYGQTYGQAVNRYQTRYNAPPAEVRNRSIFRSTGRTSRNNPAFGTSRQRTNTGNRSTGYGYGTNTLRRSNRSTPTRVRSPRSFGSGRSFSRSGRRR